MKKNVNKFEGFYEDEESIKMLNTINKVSNEYQTKKQKQIKKQNKKDLLLNVLVGIAAILLIVLVGILVVKAFQYNSEMVNDFMNSCQSQGYSYNYCVSRS